MMEKSVVYRNEAIDWKSIEPPQSQQRQRSSSALLRQLRAIITKSSDSPALSPRESSRDFERVSEIDDLSALDPTELDRLIRELEKVDQDLGLTFNDPEWEEDDLEGTWKSLEDELDEYQISKKVHRSLPGSIERIQQRTRQVSKCLSSIRPFGHDSEHSHWEEIVELKSQSSRESNFSISEQGFIGYELFKTWSGNASVPVPEAPQNLFVSSGSETPGRKRATSMLRPLSVVDAIRTISRFSHAKDLPHELDRSPGSWKALFEYTSQGNIPTENMQKLIYENEQDYKILSQLLEYLPSENEPCRCSLDQDGTKTCKLFILSSLRLKGVIPFLQCFLQQSDENQPIAFIILAKLLNLLSLRCMAVHGIYSQQPFFPDLMRTVSSNSFQPHPVSAAVLVAISLDLNHLIPKAFRSMKSECIYNSLFSQPICFDEPFLISMAMLSKLKIDEQTALLRTMNVLLGSPRNTSRTAENPELFEALLTLVEELNDTQSVRLAATVISHVVYHNLGLFHQLLKLSPDCRRVLYFSILSRISKSSEYLENDLLEYQFVILEYIRLFVLFPEGSDDPLHVFTGWKRFPDEILVHKVIELLEKACETGVIGVALIRTNDFDPKVISRCKAQIYGYKCIFEDISQFMKACKDGIAEEELTDLVFSLSLAKERSSDRKSSILKINVLRSMSTAGSLSSSLLKFYSEYRNSSSQMGVESNSPSSRIVKSLLKE